MGTTLGGAVVRTLLKDGTYTHRAIARNPESETSLKLKAQGVDVVKAIFGVTAPIFPIKADGPNEVVMGKNMVDAAKEVGVKFFIWSGMPSISRISGGKYTGALHYDHKEVVEEYLKASGLPNATLYLGGFLENYWKHGILKKTDEGKFDVAVVNFKATDKQAFTWAEREVPAATIAILKNYTEAKGVSGKSYPLVNACITYAELAERTGKALGAEVKFTGAPPSGMKALDEMFAAHAEYSGLYTATPVPNPDLVTLGVKFGTIEEFLEAEVKPRFGQQ